MADFIEGFSLQSPLKPYDQFIALNDYEPIEGIEQKTVDLVICTIGLHHIPVEKLDSFIVSIKKLLRPGGIFIVRDHDVIDQDVLAIVNAAHTIFNVALAEENLENELSEYRNFQPLSYWIELLHKHGFDVSGDRIQQNGDPSMNTLIKATVNASTGDEYESVVQRLLKYKGGHYRDIIQTYLTAPEWISVDISQEYGNFINHTPFYEFPWIKNIAVFWKVFYESCNAAVKKRGLWPVISSPYTLMNMFIGTTFTVEYAIKAMISAPIRYIYSGTEAETLQALVYDPANEIMNIHSGVRVLELLHHDLKLIEVPRYKEFLNAMVQLAQTQLLEMRTIGGQQEIVCKIRSCNNSYHNIVDEIAGSVIECEWKVPTQQKYTYANITVPVHALKKFIQLMVHQGNELLYVHDF